ncbi:MAG TPA: NHL repeat-containing protein [Candidatus Limnocylindrales bacterium]|nr:NHL repeat-containing protein [Candidatus Limnocylindrales bacterium]
MRRAISFSCAIVALMFLVSLASRLYESAHAESGEPSGAPLDFIGAWGTHGDGPGQLDDPISISADVIGNIYVVDAGSRFIHKFDAQGTPLLSFQEDPLKHPQWVTVDRGEVIYVSDPVRNSVFICLPTGVRDRYHELRLRARAGKQNQLSVAVEDDGLIYVLDSNAAKVFTFNTRMRLTGTWVPSIASQGSKISPGPFEIGPDGNFYIAQATNGHIFKYSPEKRFVTEIYLAGDGARGKLSSQFAVSKNYLFAMDTDGRMLHVFTLDGVSKLDLDLAPELGQAARPVPPLAVSPRGELLVLDGPESRVLRFRINF